MLTLLKKVFYFFTKKDMGYVSPVEKFMTNFDREYPQKSASQITEIKKYARIDRLRDRAN